MTNPVAMSRRISDLEEENRALREALECAPVNLHLFLGLTVNESRFLREMERASPNLVRHDRLLSMLDDAGSRNAKKYEGVLIHDLRRKLERHAIEIRNERGVGYCLDSNAKRLLDALLDEVAAREGFDRTTVPWRAHV